MSETRKGRYSSFFQILEALERRCGSKIVLLKPENIYRGALHLKEMATLSLLWTRDAFILEIVWWRSQNTVFVRSTIQAGLTINANALFLGKKFCSAIFSCLK